MNFMEKCFRKGSPTNGKKFDKMPENFIDFRSGMAWNFIKKFSDLFLHRLRVREKLYGESCMQTYNIHMSYTVIEIAVGVLLR